MRSMAMLKLKQWGGSLRGKEKVGGKHKCLTCMVIFRFLEDSLAVINPIKPSIGL